MNFSVKNISQLGEVQETIYLYSTDLHLHMCGRKYETTMFLFSFQGWRLFARAGAFSSDLPLGRDGPAWCVRKPLFEMYCFHMGIARRERGGINACPDGLEHFFFANTNGQFLARMVCALFAHFGNVKKQMKK